MDQFFSEIQNIPCYFSTLCVCLQIGRQITQTAVVLQTGKYFRMQRVGDAQ